MQTSLRGGNITRAQRHEASMTIRAMAVKRKVSPSQANGANRMGYRMTALHHSRCASGHSVYLSARMHITSGGETSPLAYAERRLKLRGKHASPPTSGLRDAIFTMMAIGPLSYLKLKWTSLMAIMNGMLY